MKRLLLLLLTIIFYHCYSQEPPKKSSKIIVAPNDSTGLLNRIALALLDKGFEIDRKDSELRTVTTKERSMPKGSAQTKIQARIVDTTIIFTSTLCVQIEMNLYGVTAKPTFDPVTYSGIKGSYMRVAWKELDEIARKFGSNILYSK
jgi:hypothetical protein